MEEALEKIKLGMKIQIREGSAARNLNSLKELIKLYPDYIMLCSDDLHPEMLLSRHINKISAGLIREGYDLFDVLRASSLNPVEHYKLESGLLRKGDSADFVVTANLNEMEILETWIEGKVVFDGKETSFKYENTIGINRFNCSKISVSDIRVKKESDYIRVITAKDGELITGENIERVFGVDFAESNPASDILKIVVKDRYNDKPPAVGFIKGFGLKSGSFGSSVAHDSHNIIAVGTTDREITTCINKIVEMKGGLVVCNGSELDSLELGIGGIMTDKPCKEVAEKYQLLSEAVKRLGCKLQAPFMTLSFMALLVIPSLKISDRGLFDGNKFSFTSLFTI